MKTVSCSIIVPVLNEAPLINGTIEHLHDLQGDEAIEIIVSGIEAKLDDDVESIMTNVRYDNVAALLADTYRAQRQRIESSFVPERKEREIILGIWASEISLEYLRLASL